MRLDPYEFRRGWPIRAYKYIKSIGYMIFGQKTSDPVAAAPRRTAPAAVRTSCTGLSTEIVGNCWLGTLFLGGILSVAATSAGDEPSEDPARYLTFSSETDGRCHILSAGGKLRSMRNTHPNRTIRYRLIRYFGNVPQPGRVVGDAAPGDERVKLGCTLVDNVEQRWELQRAAFVE